MSLLNIRDIKNNNWLMKVKWKNSAGPSGELPSFGKIFQLLLDQNLQVHQLTFNNKNLD